MTPARRQLLEALGDGGFHSGEALGQALGMSRAAVWKHVRALRRLGVPIESQPGQGYRLSGRGPALDPDAIGDALDCRAEVSAFDELDSTSSELIRRLAGASIHRHAILAEFQTSGRGRRGRDWQSVHGQGLCLSAGWRFDGGMGVLSGLSLALGVAAAQALSSLGVARVMLKWPNDLMLDDGKLGGILLELRGELDGPGWLVAGIGINVHGGGDGATRSDLSHCGIDRNRIAAEIIRRWFAVLEDYPEAGLRPWLEAFRHLDWLHGMPVRAGVDGEWVEGLAEGVDRDGGLRVRTDEGLRVLSGGEVTVRRGHAAV